MMRRTSFGLIVILLPAMKGGLHAAPTLKTLFSFSQTNGSEPSARLAIDAAGNLFGTTYIGGAYYGVTNPGGTAFELSGSDHLSFSTLVNFDANTTGDVLYGGLTSDAAGNLYGTTEYGGTNNDGTLFELSGSDHKTLTTVLSFGSTDPNPRNSLLIDAAGNIFGTTSVRGSSQSTIFEAFGTNHQTLVTLATMNAAVYAGLTLDKAGNLFGTTTNGGTNSDGTVFELSGANHQTLTTLDTFTGGSGGEQPQSTLVFDSAGNLYGTTGGNQTSDLGTVFELSGTNYKTLMTLVNFNGSNGQSPVSALLVDAAGNLYGTTFGNPYGSPATYGNVFELSGNNHQLLTTLFSFDGTTNANPEAGLIADSAGSLYGTTYGGGPNRDGTVFELTGTGFAVPEPTGLCLVMVNGLALLRRRRSRLGIVKRPVCLQAGIQ